MYGGMEGGSVESFGFLVLIIASFFPFCYVAQPGVLQLADLRLQQMVVLWQVGGGVEHFFV